MLVSLFCIGMDIGIGIGNGISVDMIPQRTHRGSLGFNSDRLK